MPKGNRATDLVEGTALTASFLCLIHCLALPLLLLILPGILGAFAASKGFHMAAFALVAPAAFCAFWLGYRHHRVVAPGLTGMVGVLCIGAALLPGVSHAGETMLTVVGSLFLVAGHLWNWRKRSAHHACPSGDEHCVSRRG
ncbi:MerC family mercury resistance protein [Altererythrobacter indicus]|uniref:MerC family mercury resistance protein n=1 Tax=Altericroceibacterium indicum TaxID=374177 RepID=A0A845A7D2_9SPHN|nr:MerC domain-containing protein [Altericroceibacterium indicum]MXP26282.1 MerC family mercury resistance protein [Altericroceibacterium indicum]